MSDSSPSHSDDSSASAAAWSRHYAEAAERRRAAFLQHRNQPRPYLRYARREARWALAIVALVIALLIGWTSLYR